MLLWDSDFFLSKMRILSLSLKTIARQKNMKMTFLKILFWLTLCAVVFSSCESDPILKPQTDSGEDKGSYGNSNFFELSPTAKAAPRSQSESQVKFRNDQTNSLNPERF